MAHTTDSINRLEAEGFYPDLIASMRGFMEHMHSTGQCALGKQIAEQFAAGFLAAPNFSTDPFRPDATDPLFKLKSNYLDAIQEIFERFRDRLPRQLYATLAFLGTRDDPTIEERIPEIEHLLPDGMNWKIADSILHALGVSFRLHFDVQSTINKRTGFILGHGCACGCAIAEMSRCVVDARMGDKPAVVEEETQAFLRHALSQCFLLHFGLPQGIGESLKIQRRNQTSDQIVKTLVLKTAHHEA